MDRRTRRELTDGLNRDASRIASHFGLRYQKIEAERGNVTSHYGICYSDGTIRIRLRHAVSGHPLKYSSLVNTLCHELAHLRHFHHGIRFRVFYLELLEFARSVGIYRPGRSAPVEAARTRPPRRREKTPVRPVERPAQLSLF